MSLAELLTAVQTIIAHLVGGTIGSGSSATTVTFAESWVGMFLSTLTTSNGLLLISFILSICLFGIHCLLSLMRR